MTSPATTEYLGSVDLTASPLVLRDAEAALLGLLPDGHVLGEQVQQQEGGAVGRGPGSAAPSADSPVVGLRTDLDPGEGNGISLVDEENTPVALVGPLDHGAGVATGRIRRVRSRESGEHADLALTADDLAALSGRRLLVLDRPPTDADGPELEALLSVGDDVLVLVPDSPAATVPLTTLVAVARTLLTAHGEPTTAGGTSAYALGGGGSAELRVAPLGWRDPASDAALLARVEAALAAPTTLHLGSDGPGGARWDEALAALQAGRGTTLPGVSPEVAHALLRWRPQRAERGLLIMFTGFSGSGKSTVARDLSNWVAEHSDRRTTLLDGDLVRQMLSAGLGFDRESRIANVRRIGYVGAEVARHGGIAICSPIAPYASTRAEVRAMVEPVGDFVLVHVNTPLEECEKRDLKGLYAKARAGIVTEFTGISDPYDVPEDADLRVDTSQLNREEALAAVLEMVQDGGWLATDDPAGGRSAGGSAEENA